MRKLTLFLILVGLFSSCNVVFNKSSYIKSFESFIESLEKKDEISDDRWETAEAEYEKFIGKYYEKYRNKLTSSDQQKIGELKARYYKIFTNRQIDKFQKKADEISNQVEGFINEILN